MIIAFNSMDQAGQEILPNMVASAFAMTILRNVGVVLLEGGFGEHKIQEALVGRTEFMVKEPFAYMDGEGMDYLMKRSRYNLLCEKTVSDGIVYLSDHIGYVPSAVRKNRPVYEMEFERECQNILQKIDKETDYVFVDCSGTPEKLKQKIQKAADLIVVNVSQLESVLDEYFSYPSSMDYKTVYCIGNYVKEEPCNLKNIQRLYRIGNRSIGVIPYNVEFLSSLHKGKVFSFFENHLVRSRYYRNKEFFSELYKLAEGIFRWEEEHCVEDKAKAGT